MRRVGKKCFLIVFNITCSIRGYFTLLHYYNKKRVEWYNRIKNNIIYYIYNYYLPQYPLKNHSFFEKYDKVILSYET